MIGPRREDDRHELLTVYQAVGLSDRISVEPASRLTVEGFAEDTIVRRALELLDAPTGWRVRIEKSIPVAAGLAGGSSDAATALLLANAQLPEPMAPRRLHEIAARVGADVPFFLTQGPQLGAGDGTVLEPLDLPQDFAVLLLLPHGVAKASTAEVYADFDARHGEEGYEARFAALRGSLGAVAEARDLARLPPNDLASSSLVGQLVDAGAFRADVSGAGPILYGLFEDHDGAERARQALGGLGQVFVTFPAWYG